MNQRIAVLMTVHNRKAKTLRCLECLYGCRVTDGFFFEVYMTDDGCTDGTAKAVAEKYPEVHVIQGDGTLYWNRGMWTAWNEAAKEYYDFYLWLNDDTFLYPIALEKLISASEELHHNSIVAGSTEDEAHGTITYGGHAAGNLCTPGGKLVAIDYFNGNIVLVPRSVFSKVGNLDYGFRHSLGDYDYGMRAAKIGVSSYMVGDVLGICETHQKMDDWCNPSLPFIKRIKALYQPNGVPPMEFFYYDRKHHGILSAVKHYMSIHLGCVFPMLWIKDDRR